MKKRILLIGNNNGLPGVTKDINNYQSYFKDRVGGEWYDSEIKVMMNTTVTTLRSYITTLRSLNLDYLVVVYSGHGASHRRTTVLELSENQEIAETELMNIAPRQLNIYDCCRSALDESINLSEKSVRSYSSGGAISRSTRLLYEARIREAIPQQARLYACSLNETAEDTPDGGAYSYNLIKSAVNFGGSQYKTIGSAHADATEAVKAQGYTQNPESYLPRCLTSQSLIWSIDPYYGTVYRAMIQ